MKVSNLCVYRTNIYIH